MNRMTDRCNRCKNITLPKLRLRAVITAIRPRGGARPPRSANGHDVVCSVLSLLHSILMLSRCECLDGYEQINDTHCEDRDECAFQPNLCAPYGSCSNTEGSYKCICRAGFRNVDGVCVGQWHFRSLEFDVKYLIFRNQLNKMEHPAS